MSIRINLDLAAKPFVIAANVGVNALTRLYYSCLNPKRGRIINTNSTVKFHYNVKATLFNVATALVGISILRTSQGKSSLGSALVIVPTMLFLRLVVNKSMSVPSGAKAFIQGAWKELTNVDSLEGISFMDQGYSSFCMTLSKSVNLCNNRNWKENIGIQGYPILKNWSSALI